jgi:predicted RNase H-like nuclease (RuvC/YqgF family)
MKDAGTLISGIFYKIKILAERNERLTEEIESLKHQNLKLQDELISQDEVLRKLQQDLDVIKITKTINSDDDRDKTKSVIDDLVRRIDNSLNLLNK